MQGFFFSPSGEPQQSMAFRFVCVFWPQLALGLGNPMLPCERGHGQALRQAMRSIGEASSFEIPAAICWWTGILLLWANGAAAASLVETTSRVRAPGTGLKVGP